ncbi:ras-specific guanine nucleotide-releasing factor [Thraustotheca clavata]|uniref:Ras-specific guanine nucleotide-releasing factor n=1 Tax=Thraustotheca clavata TaxID=74557 RepID=A0A1V9Z7R6_9STRA|nr:ras-specific guanine nucleotide-releasing factor [Thraustotheca clavata]
MSESASQHRGDIRMLFRQESADTSMRLSFESRLSGLSVPTPSALMTSRTAIYVMEDSDIDDDESDDTLLEAPSIPKMIRHGSTTRVPRATSQSTMASGPSRTGGNLIHSGWLVKQGNIWKSWKKRFFVLLTKSNPVSGEPFSCLQYYKSHRFGRLKGEIALDDANTSVRFLDIRKSKRPHCFELVKGFNAIVCQAKDDEECSRWVMYLQDVIASNHTTSAQSQAHPPIRLSSGMLVDDDPEAKAAVELRKILSDPKNPEASKCMAFVKHFDARSSHAFASLREFIANMRTTVTHKYAKGLVSTIIEHFDSENDALESIYHCIHRHVEEVVFLPLHDGLYANLRKTIKAEHEAALNKKLRWLQGKEQAFYDIPQHQLSNTEWREASRILGQISTFSLPSDKYDALYESIVEIQASYQDDHPAPEFMYQAQTSLDGIGFNSLVPGIANRLDTDDLIPIFTFVLVNSGLENLLLLKQLLTEMHMERQHANKILSSSSAMGILIAAMDFIQNVTIPAVLEDIFKEQVAFTIDGDWKMGLGFEPESTYRCGAMVKNITAHGQAALGGIVSKGHVLVSLNGTNVVLWPYNDVIAQLNASAPPHHMAFISNPNYVKILGTNKSLWNVALMQACQRGTVGSVQMLLANGAEVNYMSDDETTPLHVAVSCMHVNVVSYLLQHGAKTKVLSPHGRGPLHLLGAPCALMDGPSQEVSIKVASMQSAPDKVRQIILKLVRHGAAMDEVDHFGYTPLMLLAHKGCLEGVDTLVELSKNLNINGRSWQRGCSALACAAQEGQSDVTTALIDYGADTEIRSLRGETPLHFAASIACLATCGVLLSEGKADVNARTHDGLTPLMMAVSRGQLVTRGYVQKDTAAVLDTVRLLLNERANVRDVCSMYRQAIHYAAMYGGPDVYYFLKTYPDVDINAPDITGKTAAALFEQSQQNGQSIATIATGRSDRNSLILSFHGSLLEPKPAFVGGTSPEKMDLGRSPPISASLETATSSTDLVVDTNESKEELQAGTVQSIVSHIIQYDSFNVQDIESFLWAGTHFTDYKVILTYLEEYMQNALPEQLKFARRVVLYTLDIWINHLQTQMTSKWPLCHAISHLVISMLPAIVDNDPLVLQWLTFRQIALFVKACKANDPSFSEISPCDRDYAALANYLQTTAATLAFLDTPAQSKSSSNEPELAEKMRERLAIAGVLPQASSSHRESKVLVVPAKSKRRYSVLDRVARLWQLDIDPGLVASQITLLQHWFFQKMPISDLLSSKRSAATTPSYDRLRLLHNHCSLWVVNQILAREDVVDRAAILSYYIKVAGKCLNPLRNYDGFMAIMNALNDSSVFRLKKTWGRLPPAVRTLWQELKKWTEKGARPLHKLIKEVAVPSIPYLGLIIQQIVVAQEYPDTVQNDLINFKKIRLTGNVVRLVVPCQKTPYIFSPDKRLLDNLSAPLQLSTKDICFSRSLEIEPRFLLSCKKAFGKMDTNMNPGDDQLLESIMSLPVPPQAGSLEDVETEKRNRGNYRCSRCGEPKKGHVCPYQPANYKCITCGNLKKVCTCGIPLTRTIGVQCELDEDMTTRVLDLSQQGIIDFTPHGYMNL